MLASLGRVSLGVTLFLGSLVAPFSLAAQDAPPSELSLRDARPDGSGLGSLDEDGPASAPNLMDGVVWNNVRTDRQAGLCIKADTAIRATEIAAYVDDVRWYYSASNSAVESPEGNYVAASSDWNFPAHPRFAIVFYQPERGSTIPDLITTRTVWGQTESQPTVIRGLRSTRDLCFNVNDQWGTYNDNAGSFDLHVRVQATD
jgi:hypothetical protein